MTAAVMISRLVLGTWHDLSWRHEVSRPARLAWWQARRGWWIAGVLLITLAAGAVWLSYGLSLRNGGDPPPLQPAAHALCLNSVESSLQGACPARTGLSLHRPPPLSL